MGTELRVALIGKAGIGKSSLGNSLLGKKIFHFKSSGAAVTQRCELGKAETSIGKLSVVDTPGLFDTDKPNGKTIEELMKSVALLTPGPHVFIMVLSVTRLTKEDLDTMDILKNILGEGIKYHVIVVFTRKDQLDDDITEDDFIATTQVFVKNLLKDVSYRYEFICNRVKGDSHEQDVKNILSLIRKTVQQNAGRYYTQDMFQAAESVIQKEIKQKQKIEKKTENECREEIKTAIAINEPGIMAKIIEGLVEIFKVVLPKSIETIGEYFMKKK